MTENGPAPRARLPIWRPVFVRYLASISADTLKLVLFVLLGVEAIFLLELIVSHLLPHVLKYQAGTWNLLALLGLSAPEALFISLPVAVLVATYLIFLRRREAGEFIMLAGMGQSTKPLIALVLLFALVSALAGTFLSSFAEPHTRYLLGKRMLDIKFDTLRSGNIGAGTVHEYQNIALFTASGSFGDTARDIFILQGIDDDKQRLIMAHGLTRFSESSNEQSVTPAMGAILRQTTAYDFILQTERRDSTQDCDACVHRTIKPTGIHGFNRFLLDAPELDFPEAGPREALSELTSWELLRTDLENLQTVRILQERLIRTLLCFIVPLLAMFGIVLTIQKTSLLILPMCSVLVLSISFFGPHLARTITPLGMWPSVSIIVLITAILGGGLVWIIASNEARCYRRQGVRL